MMPGSKIGSMVNPSRSEVIDWSPLAPISVAWRNRKLILRLTRREVEARYRGAWFGLLWSAIIPLLTALVYSFVFGHVFKSKWDGAAEAGVDFTLLLFFGVLIYSVFAECLNRSPSLMLENVSYIKKVVFPLEIMPWVSLFASLFNFAIGVLVLLCIYVFRVGVPPVTALLLPIVIAPMLLTTLGITWLFAALGVFLRDLKQVVGILTTMLMFLSPIFYPISAVQGNVQKLIQANPLAAVLEGARDVFFFGRTPPLAPLAISLILAWIVAWVGYVSFAKMRKGFADVV